MSKPVVFTTPSGDRMAILPLSEYQRLVAAAKETADGQSYDTAKARVASGEEELIPAEFVKRILDGESPLRVWREFRGLSARELASKAGVSQPYLSQIETGERDGRVETMKSIAEALGVSLDDIV